jgi:hypothetical protein
VIGRFQLRQSSRNDLQQVQLTRERRLVRARVTARARVVRLANDARNAVQLRVARVRLRQGGHGGVVD